MADKHIFGTVDWTDAGSPVDKVRIVQPGGSVVETQVSARSSIGFGIENPEYKERVHALLVTDAGNIKGVDEDMTSTWHTLVREFPEGSEVPTLTLREGSREYVHVLKGYAYGGVTRWDGVVARLIGRRWSKRGILMKQHGNGSTVAVQQLAQALYGSSYALDPVTVW